MYIKIINRLKKFIKVINNIKLLKKFTNLY